jgi:hypothetical protein
VLISAAEAMSPKVAQSISLSTSPEKIRQGKPTLVTRLVTKRVSYGRPRLAQTRPMAEQMNTGAMTVKIWL